MADVDSLDVHGVRYAEIHTGLKRDMKLGGIGFIALIDFTTVDTMRASLERVIADKWGRESKIETMCYYKKRRRGAVVIRTQRDVMLACCEYPLVTSTGKPAPDPYIRVGVLLQGKCPVPKQKDTLKANLNVHRNPGLTIGETLSLAELKRTAGGRGSGPIIRSVVGSGRALNATIPHLRADTATKTQTFILDDQPASKKVCLDSDVEWALALPGKSGGTVEIRPIDTDPTESLGRSSPDLSNLSPPELPLLIKEEPIDMEESGIKQHTSRHKENDNTLNTDTKSSDNLHDTSSMMDDEEGDEDDDDDDHIPLVICPKVKDNTNETEFKQMWDQIRKMESRLNYMDHNKGTKMSTTHNDQDEVSGSSEDISSKIASLEQRLYSMEKGKEESDAPLLYIGDRLSKVEKNVTKILSAVDKLSKSLVMVHRKHAKSNTAIDVISTNLKEINESQAKTAETLEKISLILEKNIA